MIIAHNMNALRLCRQMAFNDMMIGKSIQRLSSGKRINCAADDPAGLAISEKMKSQIRGLEAASRNAQDTVSMIQVAEGGATEIQSMMQRMRELSVQAANGTYSDDQRKNIKDEMDQLYDQINSIAKDTNFNTIPLLNSNMRLTSQVGANPGDTFNLKLSDITTDGLGISGGKLDVSTPEKSSETIKVLDDALNKVSSCRSSLGAQQNALEYRIDYLDNAAECLTAAESRITDVDMAKEMMNYSKYSILQQVAQALFAQVNKQGESVIQLLKSL